MTWNAEELVLWSDETIVAANKPAGLLVIRGGFAPEPYLAQILETAYGRLWTVHRLDRETSGVVVFARSAAAHRELNTQFEKRDVAKIYHALVVGVPAWAEREVSLPLLRDGDRRHRTVVDSQGKPSSTKLKVLERLPGYALLEAIPRTGRTHQIRAHLSALGYPIVGDELYGGTPKLVAADIASRDLIARSALHAQSIIFAHPASGEAVHLSAPYPEDLSRTLAALRLAAQSDAQASR